MLCFTIYQITNNVNNKIYVGVHKTNNMDDGYMGYGTLLRRVMAKYGIANFSKQILEFFNTQEQLFAREKAIITPEFISRNDVYNIREGGAGGFDYLNRNGLKPAPRFKEDNPFYGKHHTDETKRKLSEARNKQVMPLRTKEHNEKIKKALTGVKLTDERKANISKAKKGRPAYNKGVPAQLVICPYCVKAGGKSNMTRWHFDNCKEKGVE